MTATIAEVLEGKRICVCAGSGGVGKTTVSAAAGLAMASRGARVAVVTIDPARRLAQALGLEELGNEPHLVDAAALGGEDLEVRGELWAMMLDAKRTFDELVERLAPDERTRDEVLGNRVYGELSSAVAGSQEFTAIAKLYDLDASGRFDLIVLDTPPSRNALDFLDAPDRLTRFFEGRALSVLLRPTGIATRLVGRGTGLVFSVLGRATGVDLLQEVSTFFRALGGMIDGFRERTRRVGALLEDPGTTFVLVTSPEPEPVDEALWFHRKLRAAGMSFGACVVNRLTPDGGDGRADPEQVQSRLEGRLGAKLAARVARAQRDHDVLVERDRASLERLADQLGAESLLPVPQLPGEVSDGAGLSRIARLLLADPDERARLAAEAA